MRIWEVTCRGGRGGETRGATGPDRPGCRSIARGRVRWGHGRRSGRGGGCRARSRAGIARASLRAHHQTPKPPKRTAVSKTFERECRRTDLPTASAPTRHPTRAVEDGKTYVSTVRARSPRARVVAGLVDSRVRVTARSTRKRGMDRLPHFFAECEVPPKTRPCRARDRCRRPRAGIRRYAASSPDEAAPPGREKRTPASGRPSQ
jgi:hypothetical protein